MIQLAIFVAFVSTIFAIPIADKWDLPDFEDYAIQELGSCDASGIPTHVMETLGFDPSRSYEITDEQLTPNAKTCKRNDFGLLGPFAAKETSDQTARQILDAQRSLVAEQNPLMAPLFDGILVLAIKTAVTGGEIAVLLCDAAIDQLQLCLRKGLCSWNDPELVALSLMSVRELKETLEHVTNHRSSFARIQDVEGYLKVGKHLLHPENVLTKKIFNAATQPIKKWFRNCIRSLDQKEKLLREKYCNVEEYY